MCGYVYANYRSSVPALRHCSGTWRRGPLVIEALRLVLVPVTPDMFFLQVVGTVHGA